MKAVKTTNSQEKDEDKRASKTNELKTKIGSAPESSRNSPSLGEKI